MPKLSDLVHDIAVVFRIDEKTVATYARHLREAGLLSQGGRGRHAANATALDAARLLIAMSVPGHAKDSPEAVADFGGLVMYQASEADERPKLRIAVFLGLETPCSLESTLAAIIAAYGDEQTYSLLANKGPYLTGIRCKIYPVLTAATVNIGPHQYEFHHPNTERLSALDYDFSDMNDEGYAEHAAAHAEFERLHDRYFRGIRQTSEVVGPELCKIGEMLADKRAPGEADEPFDITAIHDFLDEVSEENTPP